MGGEGAGDQIQALVLAKQMVYHLRLIPNPIMVSEQIWNENLVEAPNKRKNPTIVMVYLPHTQSQSTMNTLATLKSDHLTLSGSGSDTSLG